MLVLSAAGCGGSGADDGGPSSDNGDPVTDGGAGSGGGTGGGGGDPPGRRAVSLTWLPPTQNQDGSPLDDLAGYKVYWGRTPRNLNRSVSLDNPGLTSYVVENLNPGPWYFATTAVDRDGDESERSNLAFKKIN